MHLVLRVQTDDALCASRPRRPWSGCASALTAANVQYAKLEVDRARPNSSSKASRTTRRSGRPRSKSTPSTTGRPARAATPITMRPNIESQLREETVAQALQTIERRVNELGVAEPIVARQGAVDQILVQLPGVTDVAAREGNHPVDRAARAEDGRDGTVSQPRTRRCRPTTMRCRRTSMIVPGLRRSGRHGRRDAEHRLLRGAARAAVTGVTCGLRGLRSIRTTCPPWDSRSSGDGAVRFGQLTEHEHRPAARASSSTTA